MIYIYALRCPLSGDIRYIGKTCSPASRLRAHVAAARMGDGTHRGAWVRSLLAQGRRPTMQIIRCISVGADWQQAEKEEIARHRALGCRLTNATDGGEPGGAAKWSDPELRERALAAKSERAKRQWGDRATRARMLAGMQTVEAKSRRAAATSKRMSDPDELRRHAETMRAVAQREGARKQREAASRKRWDAYRAKNPPPAPPTEDELLERARLKRERQRQSALARWQREGEIEKHRAAVWTPERREAQAKALEARREKMNASVSTEGRARQAEAMRRIWAERKATAAK